MGDMKYEYEILVGSPEEKRPFGSSRRRREDNIRTDLREIEQEGSG